MIIEAYPGVVQERIFPRSGGVVRAWVGPVEAGISPAEMGRQFAVDVRSGRGDHVELPVQDMGFLERPDGTWFVARMNLAGLTEARDYEISVRLKGTDLHASRRVDYGPPRSLLEERADEFRVLDQAKPPGAIAGLRKLSEDPHMDGAERAFVLDRLAWRLRGSW